MHTVCTLECWQLTDLLKCTWEISVYWLSGDYMIAFRLGAGEFYLPCTCFLTPKASPSAGPDSSSSEHEESDHLSLFLPQPGTNWHPLSSRLQLTLGGLPACDFWQSSFPTSLGVPVPLQVLVTVLPLWPPPSVPVLTAPLCLFESVKCPLNSLFPSLSALPLFVGRDLSWWRYKCGLPSLV